MIGVKVNDKFLVMPPDAKAALEFNNPIFDEDLIQGDLSLPLDVPYSGNGKAFGFSYETLLKSRIHNYPNASLYYNHTKLYPAQLDVLEISRNKITASLRLNFSSLPCMTRKLRDMDYGTVHMGNDQDEILETALVNASVSAGTPQNFCFPMIKNTSFYNMKNEGYEGFMNKFTIADGGYSKNELTNRNTLVPMLNLAHVLQTGFATSGYKLQMDQGYFANPTNKRLTIYHNYSIDQRQVQSPTQGIKVNCSTEPIFNQGARETIPHDNETGPGLYDPDNAHTSPLYVCPSTGTYSSVWSGTIYLKYTGGTTYISVYFEKNGVIVASMKRPFTATSYPLLRLSAQFAASSGDEIKVTIRHTNATYPAHQLQVTKTNNWWIDPVEAADPVNVYKSDIELRDYVPDITFGNLLNALIKAQNLDVKINHKNKTVIIDYFDNCISNTAYRAPALPKQSVPGHKIMIGGPGKYKSFNWTWNSDDSLVNDNFQPVNPQDLIGTFNSLTHINALYPPLIALEGKFGLLSNLNQLWKCIPDPDSPGDFKWSYYTDAWFDEIVNPGGSVDIRPECSTLMMDLDLFNEPPRIYPKIVQIGSSDEFELGRNETTLRLFYFWGISDDAGPEIPFSTSTNYNVSGDQLTSDSLAWNPYLISLWQKRIELYERDEWYEAIIKLQLHQLKAFTISDIWRFENSEFLIKQMRIQLGKSIGEAVLTCLQL